MPGPVEERRFRAKLKDKPAAEFELTALDGETVRLSALRGRPVVLAFWACGCPPCREEVPHLSRLARQYASEGLVVLAIDTWDESIWKVRRFAEEQKLEQRILLKGSAVADLYGVSSIPAVVWIDRNGTIIDANLGYHGGGSLERKTKRLLAGE